ncbi:hypothetical protein SSX86_025316 [Deinandra increscens subsp. villosa]|uniref:DUF4408 domain-containing protein n=1 Tax=Deinandra increscens subsp. villosa TaxID=3103831 RepID=A0AAP0GLA4_9ASTR
MKVQNRGFRAGAAVERLWSGCGAVVERRRSTVRVAEERRRRSVGGEARSAAEERRRRFARVGPIYPCLTVYKNPGHFHHFSSRSRSPFPFPISKTVAGTNSVNRKSEPIHIGGEKQKEMDIFDIHNVKVEKANAMLQYQGLRKIAKLLRLGELFFAVVFFSWISIRLPFVFRIFGDYLRQLVSVVVSPIFIFLIGNVIILTLVVKSGQIAGNPSDVNNSVTDLYEEITNNAREDDVVTPVTKVTEPEEIVYHDKRVISESNNKPIRDEFCDENETKSRQSMNNPSVNSVPDLDLKVYRRSQSENLTKNNELYSKLKRSETEIGRRKVDSPAEDNVVDKLSNEEFQKKIEGFIARQIRFHHEEKLAIVARN